MNISIHDHNWELSWSTFWQQGQLLGYRSFAHLDLGILCHSSLQIHSRAVRLGGVCWWTAIFISLRTAGVYLVSCWGPIWATQGKRVDPKSSLKLNHTTVLVLKLLGVQFPLTAAFMRCSNDRRGVTQFSDLMPSLWNITWSNKKLLWLWLSVWSALIQLERIPYESQLSIYLSCMSLDVSMLQSITITADHGDCWHTKSICSIWSLSIFRCIVSIEQNSQTSPNLSSLISVVLALWAKGRLSVCLAEWTDEGPQGTVASRCLTVAK